MESDLNDVINQAFKDASESIPPVERVKQLSSLAQQQLELEQEMNALEAQMDELKAKHKKVSETDIPECMNELRIKSLILENGLILTIKPYYSGKVDSIEGYRWLEDNGHGDLIRGEVKMVYPKETPREDINKIREFIKSLGFVSDDKISVHHATLSSWLREMIEGGHEVNREVLNVTTGFRAKLSLK
jgi:hypothetical protein